MTDAESLAPHAAGLLARPRRSAGVRLLAALMLIVGLLAMHGLASSHSGMPEMLSTATTASKPPLASAPARDLAQPVARLASPQHLSHADSVGHGSMLTTGDAVAARAGYASNRLPASIGNRLMLGHDMAALCLAVLTSAGLGALALSLRRAFVGGTDSNGTALLTAVAGTRPRPPPDLRGLCISRT